MALVALCGRRGVCQNQAAAQLLLRRANLHYKRIYKPRHPPFRQPAVHRYDKLPFVSYEGTLRKVTLHHIKSISMGTRIVSTGTKGIYPWYDTGLATFWTESYFSRVLFMHVPLSRLSP